MRLDLKNVLPSKPKESPSLTQPRRKRRLSRDIITFSIFVFLSATFWLVQSFQRRFTYTLRIPVTYDSIPPEVGLESKLPEFIEVTLEDEGARLLEYSTRGVEPLEIRLQRDQQLIAGFNVSASTLTSEVRQRLSATARITTISPSLIQVSAYRRLRKVVPIKLGSLPKIETGYAAGSIELSPAEIAIFGSREALADITAIGTQPLEEEKLTSTTTTKVRLSLPEGVYASTNIVQVHIPIEQLTEHSFTLPIEVTGLPDGFTLQPLPSTATVLITLPRSRYRELHAEDLGLSIAYPSFIVGSEDQSAGPPRHLPVELTRKPDWIQHYRITPDKVQYVIEEKK